MFKIKPFQLIAGITILFFLSCKKDTVIFPNKVPVVKAGLFQAISLPVDSVIVTGSATDANGEIVAYLWSQVSGPTFSVIVNPGSPATKIRFDKQGIYVFQLMATDNEGATGVDTLAVLVNPSLITTFTAQPLNNPNEIKITYNNGVAETGISPDMSIEAWTSGGGPYTVRGIIKFDLSSIPLNSTIISANLYLYSYPSPTLNGNFTDANFGADNAMLVQQVTSNWSPTTINWFNLPGTTTVSQVIAPQAAQGVLDLDLNVTNMVTAMINNNANNGFFLKMKNETYYNSRIFVASHNDVHVTKYPKLVVAYK